MSPPGSESAALESVAVLTTGRQDWGILRSTCEALRRDAPPSLRIFAGGMHLSNRYGRTVATLEADGFEPDARLAWIDDEGTKSATSQAGAAIDAVGAALRRTRPDAIVVVGDRFEVLAAALAATVERVPIAHVHGGEETLGAFDDQIRHAVTKLSHLHLVAHEDAARRVRALGERPDTVHVVGPPGSDQAFRPDLPDRTELEAFLGISLTPPVVIVTVHPATLVRDVMADVEAVIAAMDEVEATYVVTLPNADPGGLEIRSRLSDVARAPRRIAVDALGERRYWGMMRIADAMLGNSSSALIEAPVVELPAVDVGQRQAGRQHGANVIHAEAEGSAVSAALRRALDQDMRRALLGTKPAQADGRCGERVAAFLRAWRPSRPPVKGPLVFPGS